MVKLKEKILITTFFVFVMGSSYVLLDGILRLINYFPKNLILFYYISGIVLIVLLFIFLGMLRFPEE